jgi:hypothetical protein
MSQPSLLDVYNVVSTEELRKIIEMQLDAIWNNPSRVKTIAPVFLHGSPGLGKSSVIKQICESRNIDLIDVRLAQMEAVDIRGLPVPNREDKSVDWLVNGIWPRDPNGKGIIFLDEMSSCDKSVQVAAYELVLDRRLGKLYNVPPGYLIVAAGNNATDRAVASSMSSAGMTRGDETVPLVGTISIVVDSCFLAIILFIFNMVIYSTLFTFLRRICLKRFEDLRTTTSASNAMITNSSNASYLLLLMF